MHDIKAIRERSDLLHAGLVKRGVLSEEARGTVERILKLDADLRAPRQHRIFGLGNAAGLAQVLTRRAGIEAAERSGYFDSLAVLPAGAPPPPPAPADACTGGIGLECRRGSRGSGRCRGGRGRLVVGKSHCSADSHQACQNQSYN